MFHSCHSSCIYCTGPDNKDCITDSSCTSNPYNLCCNTNYFPLIKETIKKCLTEEEGTLEGYYLDSTTKTFMKCSSECKTCLSFTKCLSCDNINYLKVDGEYRCLPLNTIQEGYYIDNSLYKKCYNTCKSCSKGGTNNINNCNEFKHVYLMIVFFAVIIIIMYTYMIINVILHVQMVMNQMRKTYV